MTVHDVVNCLSSNYPCKKYGYCVGIDIDDYKQSKTVMIQILSS